MLKRSCRRSWYCSLKSVSHEQVTRGVRKSFIELYLRKTHTRTHVHKNPFIYFFHFGDVNAFNSFCEIIKRIRIGFPKYFWLQNLSVDMRSAVISFWSLCRLLHSLKSLVKITSPFHQHLFVYFTKSFLQTWKNIQGHIAAAAL